MASNALFRGCAAVGRDPIIASTVGVLSIFALVFSGGIMLARSRSLAPGLSLASPCLDMRSHALPHLDIMLACKMHPAVCLHSPPNRVQFCHTLLYAVLPYPTMWSRHFHRVVLPHCVICIYTTLDCTLTLYIRRALPCCAVHHPGGAGLCIPNTVVGTL